MSPTHRLSCHVCGQEHRIVELLSGEKAHCVRCGAVLAERSRLGPDTALVFSITGLVLAPSAALLTFVSAGKLGAVRISHLFTGVGSLWEGGMRSLAVLVLLCGGLVPSLSWSCWRQRDPVPAGSRSRPARGPVQDGPRSGALGHTGGAGPGRPRRIHETGQCRQCENRPGILVLQRDGGFAPDCTAQLRF